MAQEAMQAREPISIAYHGNIVDLLEFAEAQAIRIDLLPSMKVVTVLSASPLPSVRNFFLTIWTGSARWSINPCIVISR